MKGSDVIVSMLYIKRMFLYQQVTHLLWATMFTMKNNAKDRMGEFNCFNN